jgi:hypothetical protein
MASNRSTSHSGGKHEPLLSPSRLAFLLADIAEARTKSFRKITWHDLGATAGEIQKAIADQNIDLNDPEVSTELYAISYGSSSAAFVDVSYGGGGEAPEPFRFIHVVSDGEYIGSAGDVAS